MPWVDPETGEVTGDVCPTCEGYGKVEADLRNYRSRVTKLEREAERNLVAKRDAKVWTEALAHWQRVFPDRRVTSKGIKSARATKFFQRLDAGATPEDVRHAVIAASRWSFVVFGKRQRSGSQSDLAVDLEHICSVGNDAQFDDLCAKGREMAEGVGW